jgi:hypothetical protein
MQIDDFTFFFFLLCSNNGIVIGSSDEFTFNTSIASLHTYLGGTTILFFALRLCC